MSYNKNYLAQAQENIGTLFEISLYNLNYNIDTFSTIFVNSEIAQQIEFSNPNYLVGKSGIELAVELLGEKKVNAKLINEIQKRILYPCAEYWAGWVLIYYQWHSGLSFREILNFYPLSRMLDNYKIMHEADILKMIDLMDSVRKKL